MLDTIPHLIDTSRIVIQNIIPGKSNFEIYAPYVAVFVSLFTVVVNIWLNDRQIKNSHILLEKNIEANWKNTIKNNKITLELKAVEKFIPLYEETKKVMKDLYLMVFDEKGYDSALVQKFFELSLEQIEVIYRIKLPMKEALDIKQCLFEFHYLLESNRIKNIESRTQKEAMFDGYISAGQNFIENVTTKILEQ